MPFDRVTTGTTRVVEFLEGPLEGPKAGTGGLFKKLGVDGYNKDNGNKFVRIEAKTDQKELLLKLTINLV